MNVNSLHKNDNNTVQWYKHFWVWVMVGLPLGAVVVAFILLYISITNADAVVTEPWEKEGMAVTKVLEQESEVKQKNIQADLSIDELSKQITIKFNQPLESKQVSLFLQHPTLESNDQTIVLSTTDGSKFTAILPVETTNVWYLAIHPDNEQWVLRAKSKLDGSRPVQFKWG